MTTPEFLYRGTPRRDADRFTPKELVGGRLVVSASPDRTTAIKFVVPIEGLNVKLGTLGDIHYYVCADEKKFREMDMGGSTYLLPPNGFEPAPKVGANVWVNPNSVIPIGREEISSAIQAMIKAGVRVYFVSEEIFERFRKFPEDRLEILKSLISENNKQESQRKFINKSINP